MIWFVELTVHCFYLAPSSVCLRACPEAFASGSDSSRGACSCTTSSLLQMFQCSTVALRPRRPPHRRCDGGAFIPEQPCKVTTFPETTKTFREKILLLSVLSPLWLQVRSRIPYRSARPTLLNRCAPICHPRPPSYRRRRSGFGHRPGYFLKAGAKVEVLLQTAKSPSQKVCFSTRI